MRLSVNLRIAAIAALTFFMLLPQACTVGPKYHPPAPPTFSTYTPQPQPTETASSAGPAGEPQRFRASSDLPAQWWTLFRSAQLDSMVRDALSSSPTLESATARLKQAQEELRARTGATRYPTVTGNASVEGEQLNVAAYGIPFPNPSPFALLNGSVGVSYALDLFGANRRLIEGLRAQAEYQQWQIEGARLMLAGNVVSAAIRQAQLNAQIDTTRQMIALEQQELRIADERYRAGGISAWDLHSQRTLLAQTQSMLPPLQQQLASVNDELAVLMGKAPGEAQIQTIHLDTLRLPQDLPLSVPSSLARQRPDIRAAEAMLHQASANVGVATANLYPQITLSGSAGTIGTSFVTGGDVWNIGTSLIQPLYSGGSLRAEQRKAQAAYDEAGSEYRQTLLEAFRQVADTLYALKNDAEALQAQTSAATEAAGAFDIAAQQYQAGGISQLALLEAQRQKLQIEIDRTNSAASRYADTATLFQALGGGWWNKAPGAGPKFTPLRISH